MITNRVRRLASRAAYWLRKRTAYRKLFYEEDLMAHIVLTDLRQFCPTDATHNAGNPIDEKQVYINIGKRQVLSRIASMCNMSDDRINEIAENEILQNNKETYDGRE